MHAPVPHKASRPRSTAAAAATYRSPCVPPGRYMSYRVVLYCTLSSLPYRVVLRCTLSFSIISRRPFLPYPVVLYRAVPFYAVPCRSLPYRAVLCRSLPFSAVSCRSLPYRAVLCRTVPFSGGVACTSWHRNWSRRGPCSLAITPCSAGSPVDLQTARTPAPGRLIGHVSRVAGGGSSRGWGE